MSLCVCVCVGGGGGGNLQYVTYQGRVTFFGVEV